MYNFFVLFNIDVSCRINKNELREKYFGLQKKYHPDYSKNTDIDIALINTGYEVLSDELLRLRHILEINDIKFNETINDTNFLMQCMEWQEDIAGNIKKIEENKVIQINEAIKMIELFDFRGSLNYLEKALYLNKLLK